MVGFFTFSEGIEMDKRNLPQVFLEKGVIKLLCNLIEITLRHGCSPVNFLHVFTLLFPKNTYGGLLLNGTIA